MPQSDLRTLGLQIIGIAGGLLFFLFFCWYIYIFCIQPHYTKIENEKTKKRIREREEKKLKEINNSLSPTQSKDEMDENEIKDQHSKKSF